MSLAATVYGNDNPTTATQVTQGLLQQQPNLKGIISPNTVGIAAAAAVLDTPKYRGKIALTGLGAPDERKKYVADGTVKQFVTPNRPSGLITARSAVAPKIGCCSDHIRALTTSNNSEKLITARGGREGTEWNASASSRGQAGPA